MKSIFMFSMIVFFWVALASESSSSAENLAILSPPPNSFVEGDSVCVVVRVENKMVDDVRVAVGGKEQKVARKQLDRPFVCLAGIRLAPGMNTLTVSGWKEGKKVEEANDPVFFRSDLSTSANAAPAGFRRYYYHTRDSESGCSPCHRLDFSGIEENPNSPQQSPCYVCHKNMTLNYRQVHGPAAVWSCLECHQVRSGGRKLAARKPDAKVCNACHENDWQKKKFPHGPTAAGECTACHNPHASNDSYFLRVKTAELCVACHEDTASKPHLTSGFSGRAGHPVRISPDPFNPGRDFTCASCHNPHATDFPFMLQSDHTSMSEFCISCHKM